ncbi:Uncharacterised protein [Candidatus Venteria ishoeyi]|uniref:Uncharacterized protein n=1 Tax=Candidatus Venteria ishoeyi TaxID=1899563 RepID=A0A1H6F737_9GAMM|nr:Uncharacterised protein [Candidatus Venteria ishoeyi]
MGLKYAPIDNPFNLTFQTLRYGQRLALTSGELTLGHTTLLFKSELVVLKSGAEGSR